MKSRMSWIVVAACVLFVGTAALAADASHSASDTQRAASRIVNVNVEQGDAPALDTAPAPKNESGAQVMSARIRQQRKAQQVCGDGTIASFVGMFGFMQIDSPCGM